VEIMEKVVDKFMDEVNEQLSGKKISLALSPAARTWLAKSGYDARFGARPLSRLIQTEIKDVLSEEILFGRLTKGGKVRIDIAEDRPTFEFLP
jgi:ATP-dependent Clp protease ATP-binding subunit ClpA